MANVGTGTAGKVLTATGVTSSSAFQVLGTNSGLTDNGVLIGGGNGPITSTAALTNGQLVIGSTGTDPVAGSLSAGTGITITPGAGTITIASTAASTDLHDSRYIVGAGGAADGANYTTIASAITAATSAGGVQNIAIQPGTYTENLTLQPNINLVAYVGSELTPTVTIVGKNTFTQAGTVTISGIRLTTNSDFFLVVSGSAASIVNLENCYLNCLNNTGISHTSSSSSSKINCLYCSGDIGTTGISLFASSSAGDLKMIYSSITNNGSSTTASTMSAANFFAWYCHLDFALTTSGTTSGFQLIDTYLIAPGNTTSLTHGSTNATASSVDRGFISGATASAISVSASATLDLRGTIISSSNTNAVTGAGTLRFSDVLFSGTSSVMNTTTQTGLYTNLGQYKATTQPSFSAFLGGIDANVTGDGTNFTLGSATALTELWDVGSNFNTNGTFTAPVTGKYHFCYGCLIQQLVATNTADLALIVSGTSAGNYIFGNYGTTPTGNLPMSDSRIVQMTAGDTATVRITAGNATKVVDVYGGGSDPRTFFSGILIS